MGKRFAFHFETLDNLSWIASAGGTEAGLVVNDNTEGASNIPSPAAIHNAGIPTAVLNTFNDQSPMGAGGPWAGFFNSCKNAGWNAISGEGTSGSIVGTCMNYLPYVNYAGTTVGGPQIDMYSSGYYAHPKSGTYPHWDYIETYNESALTPDSTVSVCKAAQAAGAKHSGILIGNWALCLNQPASYFVNLLNQTGGDTVCFWGGYGSRSSSVQSLASQMMSALGTAKDGATAATTSTTATAAAAAKPVVQCPCRHIWLHFKGVDGNSTSQKLEFEVTILGQAGWVDNNENWIPNRPYSGMLGLFTRNPAGKSWVLQYFYPAADGTFAIKVGSDTAEKRYYNVAFI